MTIPTAWQCAIIPARLEALLLIYGQSHQNPINMALHWLCEPLNIWALLALCACLPLPMGAAMWGLIALLLVYFTALSRPIGLLFTLLGGLFGGSVLLVQSLLPVSLLWLAVPLYIATWIGLFIGHRIEGNFPAVFKNPHLLVLGPVWLLVTAFKLPPVAPEKHT